MRLIISALAALSVVLFTSTAQAKLCFGTDERLVFEAPDSEVDAVIKLACRVMERAPDPAVALSVPLRVDARAAANWDEAH